MFKKMIRSCSLPPGKSLLAGVVLAAASMPAQSGASLLTDTVNGCVAEGTTCNVFGLENEFQPPMQVVSNAPVPEFSGDVEVGLADQIFDVTADLGVDSAGLDFITLTVATLNPLVTSLPNDLTFFFSDLDWVPASTDVITAINGATASEASLSTFMHTDDTVTINVGAGLPSGSSLTYLLTTGHGTPAAVSAPAVLWLMLLGLPAMWRPRRRCCPA